ncbi:MAG: DUF2207 domain-containing protein [Xanthobacteraceae bacterium]|nr:DUF2207 domain-containing protein [Xanthobacteraceae bacterium]
MRRILIAALFLLSAQVSAFAQERIVNFVSDVRVLTNGDLDVTETITIQAEGSQFRRGIFRDFPTSYRNRNGTLVKVGFDVISVTRDGRSEPYKTESYSNGVRTRIGDANVFIPRGPHTYTIRYRTTRQVGFFEKFDELYWNATGNGWNFYIDSAEARITLPEGAQIGQNALYTGLQGATGKDAQVVEQTRNRIVWRTTRRLPPQNGLTVAVAWQKGIVSPPNAAQAASYFLQDNLPILAALIGLIGVGFYYLSTWMRVGRDPAAGTIIPLFGPPNDMSPAAVRYIDQLSFDNRAFTAAIVDLGVKGHLTLSETPTFSQISSRAGGQKLDSPEERLRQHLFAGGNSVALTQSNHTIIGGAKTALEGELSSAYNGKLFANNFGWSFLGFFLAVIAIGAILFAIGSTKSGDEVAAGMVGTLIPGGVMLVANFLIMAGFTSHKTINGWNITGVILWLAAAAGGLALMYGLGGGINLNLMLPALAAWVIEAIAMYSFYWLKAPSVEGQQIRDRISGFREYLSVAEEDRLNTMNPPKKTPELFEKFLPYAIALDCENAWGKKFAGVLAAAAAAGAAGYAWYHGNRDWSRDPAGFSSHLGSTVAAAISSASTAPGSSSGSGGGGSSGGGGGGGGGGGW